MEKSVYCSGNEEHSGESQVSEDATKPKPKSRLSPIQSLADVEDPTDLLTELKAGEQIFQRQLTRENSLLKPKQQEIQSDYVKKREVSNVSNGSVESLKLVGYD